MSYFAFLKTETINNIKYNLNNRLSAWSVVTLHSYGTVPVLIFLMKRNGIGF
jgi:hypothetical protein